MTSTVRLVSTGFGQTKNDNSISRIQQRRHRRRFTLQVESEFAHKESVKPDGRDGCADGHRHADGRNEQIRNGQVDQEPVGGTETSTGLIRLSSYT